MRTDVVKNVNKNNASHAVLFEAFALVMHLASEKDMMSQCVALLGKFIAVREPNIRYLGLGQNGPSAMPNMTPEMLKTATDMMDMMPPEELQKMSKMALNGSMSNAESKNQERRAFSTFNEDVGESSSNSTSRGLPNTENAPPQSFPISSLDMQEHLRNQMKNPTVHEPRQM